MAMPGSCLSLNRGSFSARLRVAFAWFFLTLLCGLLPAPASAQEQALHTSVDVDSVSLGDPIMLTINLTGSDEPIELAPLEQDFRVRERSSSRQMSQRFDSTGRMIIVDATVKTVELLPKRSGALRIPALQAGKLRSAPIDITVGEAPQGAERDMYIELEVADSEPLVNSEVRMTVRVYYDVELIDVDVDAPVADGADILQIGGGRATEAVVDGRRYRVAERDYVLYPNRSGAVTVQPVTLEALVPTDADASNRRGSVVAPVRRVVRMSDALELDVQPRPDDYTGWWLPARELTVSRERADGDGEIRVGEPLTLRTTMRAAGVRDTQFPDLAEPTIDGAVVYGEPPERSTGADENGLRAEATLDWVVIPEREGEIEIPAMTIDWYDIESHEVRVERLPAMRFDVVSATGAKDAAAPVAAPEDGKAAAGAGNDAGPEVSRDASGNPGGVSGDAGSDVPGNANDDMPGNAGGDAATRETAGRSAPPASTIAGSLRGYLVPLLGAALLAAVAALLLQWRRLRGLKVRLDALEAGSTGTAGNASISSGRDDARLEVALKEIERAAAAGDHDALHAMLQVWARRRWEGQTPPRSASRMAALVEREARLADTDDATPWQAITEALRALDRTRYRGKDKAVGEADATQLRALGRLLAALPSRPLTATPEARSVVVSGYHLANW